MHTSSPYLRPPPGGLDKTNTPPPQLIMNNINNKANQQIGKNKTTTSSQPNNLIPHAFNSKYYDPTSNKNPNDNFTLVTKQGKRNLSSS